MSSTISLSAAQMEALLEACKPPSIDATDWTLISDRFLSTAGLTTTFVEAAIETTDDGSTAYNSALFTYELEESAGLLPNIMLAQTTDLADSGNGFDLSLTRTYSASFLNRNNTGSFGDGWTFTYGIKATTDASGNVYITSGSGMGLFTLNSNGSRLARREVFARDRRWTSILSPPSGLRSNSRSEPRYLRLAEQSSFVSLIDFAGNLSQASARGGDACLGAASSRRRSWAAVVVRCWGHVFCQLAQREHQLALRQWLSWQLGWRLGLSQWRLKQGQRYQAKRHRPRLHRQRFLLIFSRSLLAP